MCDATTVKQHSIEKKQHASSAFSSFAGIYGVFFFFSFQGKQAKHSKHIFCSLEVFHIQWYTPFIEPEQINESCWCKKQSSNHTMTRVPDTLISNYLPKQPQRRKPHLPYDIDPVTNKYACIYIAFLTETMYNLSWMDIGSYTHAYLQIQYSFIHICALSLR